MQLRSSKIRLERAKDPFTNQRLHQSANATGAVAGAELQRREGSVLGVGINISSAGWSEQGQIPEPDPALARCTHRSAAAGHTATVLAPVEGAAQPDRSWIGRQPCGAADQAMEGEITGVDARAVLLGGDVVAAHQEALEYMRGHHRRGGVTGNGVLTQ